MSSSKLLSGRLEDVLDGCLLEGKNPAVLLIDMQKRHADVNGWYVSFHNTIARQAELLQYARKISLPIFVSEFERHFSGTTLPKLMESLNGYEKIKVFQKPHEDALQSTLLEKQLKEAKATTLLLMGLYASDCVLKTAKSSHRLGFQPITAPTVIYNSPPFSSKLDLFYYHRCHVYNDKKRDGK